jgi:hypothetical protein
MRGKYGLKIMILTPTIFSTKLSFKVERKLINSVYKNNVCHYAHELENVQCMSFFKNDKKEKKNNNNEWIDK